MENRRLTEFVYHVGSKAASEGRELVTGMAKRVNVEIQASGSFEVTFEGKVTPTGEWKPMGAVKSNLSGAVSTTTDGSVSYFVELIDWYKTRVRLTAVTGEVTIIGRVCY